MSVVARPIVTARWKESWPEIFEMVFGVVNIFSLNKPAAGNAGIASQLAIGCHWPGVPEPGR